MNEKSLELVKRSFKEFYFKHNDIVEAPSRIAEREFGYMQFNDGMVRHLSFRDKGELVAHLIKNVPSDVYASCAYYAYPAAPMQEKIFNGADLIFDIDVDDLSLDCSKEHEMWICSECKNVMKKSDRCSKCNSVKMEKVSLACDNCIDAGKREVRNLENILIQDLGIHKDEIDVYFSGNFGFHVRVRNQDYEPLDAPSRADIADYLMGNKIMPESLGIRKNQKNVSEVIARFPNSEDYGWRGRIARQFLRDNRDKTKVVKKILKDGYSTFKLRLNEIAHHLGAHIDPQVTMDVHRVFRLEGTLNSKSGLCKAHCHELDKFDPFTDACILSDEKVQASVRASPKFRLKDNVYGPFRNENVQLPAYAAVYLICKGLADIQ